METHVLVYMVLQASKDKAYVEHRAQRLEPRSGVVDGVRIPPFMWNVSKLTRLRTDA